MTEMIALHLILESVFRQFLYISGTSGIVDENV